MNRTLTTLACSLLVALPILGSARPQPPAGHEQITYAPHLLSPDAIINAACETISGARGAERDWDKYRELFFPDARLYNARLVHDTAIIGGQSVDDFIKAESKYLQGAGYFEKPIKMNVEQFGHIAQIRCVYESRRSAEDEQPYTRGIYSIQLVQSAGRWWILNMLWQQEDPLNPIPPEYLN